MLDDRKSAILPAVVAGVHRDRAAGRVGPDRRRPGHRRVVGHGAQRDGGARGRRVSSPSPTPAPAGCPPTRATGSSSTLSGPERLPLDPTTAAGARVLRSGPRRAREAAPRHVRAARRHHRLRPRWWSAPNRRDRHGALGPAGRSHRPHSRWWSWLLATARSRSARSSWPTSSTTRDRRRRRPPAAPAAVDGSDRLGALAAEHGRADDPLVVAARRRAVCRRGRAAEVYVDGAVTCRVVVRGGRAGPRGLAASSSTSSWWSRLVRDVIDRGLRVAIGDRDRGRDRSAECSLVVAPYRCRR